MTYEISHDPQGVISDGSKDPNTEMQGRLPRDANPGESAEEQIERRVDFLVRELDEFCAMANNSETRDLIEKEAIGIGQVHFRAGLILDFLRSDKAPKLRMIKNG